ncbi:hypothetical protein ERO13_D13G064600v2 [Gossypium hirsutum]|uniref:Major facilitator superfamily (MFS) profile domain-containing protein n=4 Tax=Gossypium TaxID=3633 RepID=A0A5J5NIB1_GOSBA|nr:equilibrative nucleotide transporter 3 [Gossypium raimondii]XP_040966153.1 equilibrative nucleotide transporter 3-like isoform X1 [Gossypium hirsutum]XP_052483172.1 equilibrative nucleotide transporter 3 [Gossypium raimondii]KAB1994048.1 hypothetical protein ES319_D13G072500v1 [Gossypium barbadense]TYG36593.1 hypothetical protein ES288_D13G076400v1 [Gossypium darwinii]KAB1994049.1 hypothetical protein ES319_D13G072500v1 [Gossypium barbadense]KAB1994050.1 hypothetical protein ES319_D13G0725
MVLPDEASKRLEGKYIAMVVCWFLGNGCLFSWNSMLTIEDYYVYLFPNYHPSRVLTLVYQPFALGTLAILAYHEAKINTRRRNLFGYTLFFLSSLAILVMDLATSGKGGLGTFIGICIISGVFGVADANVQGGMVGDLSYMRPEFIQSYVAGLAASGVITSALRLITKAAFENSQGGLRKGAILFFAISSFFEFLCVLLYAYVFPKLPVVKYYRSKAASEGSKTVASDLAAGGIQALPETDDVESKNQERLSNKELLLQNIDYAIDMFLIYALTLSIFPGFLSEDTGKHSLGSWYALVLISMYNVWDLIGRYIPLIKPLKLESRKALTTVIISRVLLVPAFYFTSKYGDQGWMIMLTSILGLSNGYLTVCVLTSAPKGYKGPEQNALGNLLVLFLLGGIFAGVTLDWLWLIGKGW